MSSKSIEKEYYELEEQEEYHLDIHDIIIPFSKFCTPTEYIYYGHEKIPFHKRHEIYRTIFLDEFSELLKDNL